MTLPSLNVRNEPTHPFADWIVDGMKSLETRSHTRLDPLIGQLVKVVRTGQGRAMVIGEVVVQTRIDLPDFDAEYHAHKVGATSTFYPSPGSTRYGYILTNARRYSRPYPAKVPRGILYSRSQPGPR